MDMLINGGASARIKQILNLCGVRLEFGVPISRNQPNDTSISTELWSRFATLSPIRHRLFGDGVRVSDCTPAQRDLLRWLGSRALVELQGDMAFASGNDARSYLSGRWLEELVGQLALDNGADEVAVSQRIIWTSRYGGSEHQNEIDVIIRASERLAFVSCKAMRPEALETEAGPERLFAAVLEARYWAEHFGQPDTLAALVTTADFYDEGTGEFRDPALAERAKILDVAVISADVGNVRGLAGSIAHLVRRLR
jgi:hypothetical protein